MNNNDKIKKLIEDIDSSNVQVGKAVVIDSKEVKVISKNVNYLFKPTRAYFNQTKTSHLFGIQDLLDTVEKLFSNGLNEIPNSGIMKSKSDACFLNNDFFPSMLIYRIDLDSFAISGMRGWCYDKQSLEKYTLTNSDMNDFIKSNTKEKNAVFEVIGEGFVKEQSYPILVEVENSELATIGSGKIVEIEGMARVVAYFTEQLFYNNVETHSLSFLDNKLILTKKQQHGSSTI